MLVKWSAICYSSSIWLPSLIVYIQSCSVYPHLLTSVATFCISEADYGNFLKVAKTDERACGRCMTESKLHAWRTRKISISSEGNDTNVKLQHELIPFVCNKRKGVKWLLYGTQVKIIFHTMRTNVFYLFCSLSFCLCLSPSLSSDLPFQLHIPPCHSTRRYLNFTHADSTFFYYISSQSIASRICTLFAKGSLHTRFVPLGNLLQLLA